MKLHGDENRTVTNLWPEDLAYCNHHSNYSIILED